MDTVKVLLNCPLNRFSFLFVQRFFFLLPFTESALRFSEVDEKKKNANFICVEKINFDEIIINLVE